MVNLLIKRRAAGLSQKELGAIVGASPNSICCWENGVHAVRGDMLLKLAAALNCSPAELLEEQKEESKVDILQRMFADSLPQKENFNKEDAEDMLVKIFFKLPPKNQKRLLTAMANYACKGITPNLKGLDKLYFDAVSPHIQYVGGEKQ